VLLGTKFLIRKMPGAANSAKVGLIALPYAARPQASHKAREEFSDQGKAGRSLDTKFWTFQSTAVEFPSQG
jgi:hypothetical protein